MVFCNTSDQRHELISKKIFPESKVKVLYDPVFSIKEVLNQRKLSSIDKNFQRNNIIMVGRLTKQKILKYLLRQVNIYIKTIY